MEQEHKNKIGRANKIALKKFHKDNPDYKNDGMFKKGHNVWNKGKENPKVQGSKHPKWNGGSSRGYSYKFKDDKCTICNSKEKLHVHHINGIKEENNKKNISTVCTYCHYAIHENGKNTQFGGLLINAI